jgi:hypothetical protein
LAVKLIGRELKKAPATYPEDSVYLETYKDDKGRIFENIVTVDGRRLSGPSIASVIESGSRKYDAKKRYDLGTSQLSFNKTAWGYNVAKEVIPLIGVVLGFILLLGFGSAGLNYVFSGNNLYYFIAIILLLLFFIKKKK